MTTVRKPGRRLVCTACGTTFGCSPQGPCWCAGEDFRLPVPPLPVEDGGPGDCLCPKCLRKLALAIEAPALDSPSSGGDHRDN